MSSGRALSGWYMIPSVETGKTREWAITINGQGLGWAQTRHSPRLRSHFQPSTESVPAAGASLVVSTY